MPDEENFSDFFSSAREINLEELENIINKVYMKRSPKLETGSRSYFTNEIPYPLTVFLQNAHPNSGINSGTYNQILSTPEIKWKAWLETKKSNTELHKRKSKSLRKKKKEAGRDAKKSKRYLDYSNSQMPFNEGKSRDNKVDEKISKSKENEQKSSECESNIECRYEDLQDGFQEQYSRVRRFLDRERVKKLVRAANTLDAKEAAMSRVLDPNLNLEGILEPHVRKRREEP